MVMFTVQRINFLTSTVANGRPISLWKVSTGSDQLLMSYFPFIFSSDQHVQHMKSQILLILINFDSFFWHFLIWNYSSLNLSNSGTRSMLRNSKRRSSWFSCSLKFTKKPQHFSCTLKENLFYLSTIPSKGSLNHCSWEICTLSVYTLTFLSAFTRDRIRLEAVRNWNEWVLCLHVTWWIHRDRICSATTHDGDPLWKRIVPV